MLVSRPKKVSLTLFCYFALVLAIASVARADVTQHQARDHVELGRMLRKRTPQILPSGINLPPGLGTNGAAGDPPQLSPSSVAGTTPTPTTDASASAPTDGSQSSSSSAASSASVSSASQSSASSVSRTYREGLVSCPLISSLVVRLKRF